MTGKLLICWTFSLLLIVVTGWLAVSAQVGGLQNPPVWVQYKPGRKAAVREGADADGRYLQL